LRKHHRVGRFVDDPGEGVAVLLAHRKRRDQPVAECSRERGNGGFDSLRVADRRGYELGCKRHVVPR